MLRKASLEGGADLGEILLRNVHWDAAPERADRDLAALLNLFHPPFDYRVGAADLECHSTPEGRSRSLTTIGGSFLEQILEPITACGLLNKVEYFFYYDRLYQRWPDPARSRMTPALLRRAQTLAESDILVLEVNDQSLGKAPHFRRFLDDALLALEN
jgi:hypothetical protein